MTALSLARFAGRGSMERYGEIEKQISLDPNMATISSEVLQSLVLHALDKAPIPDSRVLQLPSGSPIGAALEDQIALKGALDSLLTREVRPSAPRQR